jgi:hypothetical protein
MLFENEIKGAQEKLYEKGYYTCNINMKFLMRITTL